MRKILVGTTNPSKPRRFQALLSEYDVEFYTLTDEVRPPQQGHVLRDAHGYTLVDTKCPPARRACVTGCPNGYTLTDEVRPPKGYALRDAHGYILKDITIPGEPKEKGITPEENAILKAQYYGQFFDSVICNDSGLYFDELALDDPRQPGLNIRTPGDGMHRLNDEEMIEYYSNLIHSLGGKVLAYYLDGFAVHHNHKIHSYMEDRTTAKNNAFYMIDMPSSRRHLGWPLDSLSLNRDDLTYFTDEGDAKYDAQDEEITDLACKKRLVDFLVSSLELNN